MAHDDLPPDAANEDDTDAWYGAIAGHGAGDGTAGEAQALRRVLLEIDREEAAAEDLAHDWEQLRFRLRREGLLASRTLVRRLAPLALAASLVVAVLIGVMLPRDELPQPESEVMRGAETQTLTVRAADPKAVADRIVAACVESGIAVEQRDAASGAVVLDLTLPVMLPSKLAGIGRELDIEFPAGQSVTLVVMRSQ